MKNVIRRNQVILGAFFLIILIIAVQLSWWVFYQVTRSRSFHDESMQLADQARYVAAWRFNQLWTDFQGRETEAMTRGSVFRLRKSDLVRVSGDTSGYSAVFPLTGKAGSGFSRAGFWLIHNQEEGIRWIHLDSTAFSLWISATFPAVRHGLIDENLSAGALRPTDLVVSPDWLYKLDDDYRRRNRMFIAEGAFFVVLLIIAIGVMYINLSRQWKYTHQIQNFMLMVTHELKSPLAGAKLNLETVIKHNPPEDIRVGFLKNAIRELNRLSGQVENILLAARLDRQKDVIHSDEINLNERLEVWFGRGFHSQDRILFGTGIAADAWIAGDEGRLQSVFSNLVENALKYSDGTITIDCRDAGETWEFSVSDSGTGIPEEALPFIFDRFFRVDDELTRKSSGVGLGLYIVKENIRLHKGTVRVESEQGHQTTFFINLPKLTEQTDGTPDTLS